VALLAIGETAPTPKKKRFLEIVGTAGKAWMPAFAGMTAFFRP
jgi:hypothetical protein